MIFCKICAILNIGGKIILIKKGGGTQTLSGKVLENVRIKFLVEGVEKIHTLSRVMMGPKGEIYEIGPAGNHITWWTNATIEKSRHSPDSIATPDIIQPLEPE